MERRPCVPRTSVPSTMQSWPWLALQLGVVTTLSWSSVTSWMASDGDRPPTHCIAEDVRAECAAGPPQPEATRIHDERPAPQRQAAAEGARSRRLEDIEIIDRPSRRRANKTTGENKEPDEPESAAPGLSDVYDDMFSRLLGLVGELLGRAAAGALRMLWLALDWLGSFLMGTWWAKLKWLSMIVLFFIFFSCIGAVAGIAFLALRSAVHTCRWSWQLVRRFSTGEVTAHEVRLAAGDPRAKPVQWRGPAGSEAFDAAYVASDVRGRGENRLPYDLLVKIDGGIARLARGQLRGRVARHGYMYYFNEVKGCSHRGLRQRLDGTRSGGGDGAVHLCSQAACTHGDASTVHAPLSAAIDGGAPCDVAEMARHGPLRRCWLGGRLLRGLCCACRRANWCRWMPARVSQGKPGIPPRVLDPLSESESEPNDEPCEAERVAYHDKLGTLLLAPSRCRDAAADVATTILEEDAGISDLARGDDGNFSVNLCRHHGQIYEAQASRRKCAKESCFREGRTGKDGFRLCTVHVAETRSLPSVPTSPQRRRAAAEARPHFEIEAPFVVDTGSAATEAKRPEQWIAYLRDPGAAAIDGWGAYYRFPAKVTMNYGEEGRGDGHALVSVEELGARYEVPMACLYPVQRGWDEFLATRPPIVCKRAPTPAGLWTGTNDEGRQMSVAAVASVARGSAEGQSLHRFGRRVSPVSPPAAAEAKLWEVTGAWDRLGPRIDPHHGGGDDPLAEWAASQLDQGAAARDLMDEYLRMRVKGLSDVEARSCLTTEDRGQGETLGLLIEEAERRCRALHGQGGAADRQEELLRAVASEWRQALGDEGGEGHWGASTSPAAGAPLPFGPGAAAWTSPSAGRPSAPQNFSAGTLLPPGLPAAALAASVGAAARAPPPEAMAADPMRGRARSHEAGAGRTLVAPAAFFGRGPAAAPAVEGRAAWAPSAEARGLAATRAWHAGAFTGPTGSDVPFVGTETRGVEASLRDLVKEMNRSNRHAEDSAGAAKGTLASIGREEGQLVFMARACDHLTVTLCVHVLEKEAFHALRAAGVNMRPLMRTIKFPTNMTNAIAYGFSAFQHGGRCHETLPDYALSCANFPHTTEADMDRYAPPKDYKLDARPRHATTLSVWFRDALRESWAWSCFYGQEHYPEQERAAQYLLDLGEKHDYAWPPRAIFGVWCELRGRWCEELRMTRRRMLELMGDESPTYDRIRFVCTSPQPDGTPWLRLPRTYQVEDPDTYFTTDILVRHESMLTRATWAMAFQSAKVTGTRKAGEDDTGEERLIVNQPKPGQARSQPDPGAAPKSGQVFGKLLGEPLLKSENGRSLDHRPKSPDSGRYLCWDHACWSGCTRKACTHSHKALGKPASLDRTVQMQLIRRGGHRSSPKIKGAAEADQKISALRKQQEQEDASKRKPHDKKSGECRGGVTFAPPSELAEVQTTDLEEDLRRLLQGPSTAWQTNHHPEAKVHAQVGRDLPDEARRRRDAMAAIDADPCLRPAADAKGPFGVFVRNRLRQLYEEHPDSDPQRAMRELALEAVSYGAPETAEGATTFLDEHFGKVGSMSKDDAFVGPIEWEADGSVGIGNMRWRGHDWTMYDYKDRLHLDEDFAATLRGPLKDGESLTEELRACAVLHVAAGILLADTGEAPGAADVQRLAAEMRIELRTQAARAVDAMGELPSMVSQAEADLRVYCHDLLFRDHDKDYRTYAAFPLPALAPRALMTMRVDYYGGVTMEAIPGATFDPEQGEVIWLLIHRGHMRLLRPPAAEWAKGALWTTENITEVPALGWEVFLEVAQWEPAQVAAKLVVSCTRCEESSERVPRSRVSGLFTPTLCEEALLDAASWAQRSGATDADSDFALGLPVVREGHSTHHSKRDVLEWLGAQGELIRGQPGFDVLEIYTDEALISVNVKTQGGTAIRIGLKYGHDLRRLRDRELLMCLLEYWKPRETWCSFPCTSFCCWVAINEARGCNMEQVKKEGKMHVNLAKSIMAYCRERGLGCTVENPWLSRAWSHLEDELNKPGWQQIRLDQCMVDLRSPDGKLHLKPTKIATRSVALAQALAKRCDGTHTHERIGGKATKASESYPQVMGDLVAKIILSKHTGEDAKAESRERSQGTRAGSISATGVQREGELKEAEEYLKYFEENPEYQPNLVAKLVGLGNALLKRAGSLTNAAAAISTVWWELHGNHLKGVFSNHLDAIVDDKLLRYVRSVAAEGVRSRYQGPTARRKAMPHPSAQEHLPELMAALWKDAAKARVLICSSECDSLLAEVVSVPMARVPKQNPDRTLSAEGRLIWDGTYPNLFCEKGDHPPADQPKHEELIREILYWKLRFPGVPVMLAKKDVKDAFRWLPYHPSDVHTFGADLSGKQWGVKDNITVVYLVLTFGWSGSPGEWMAWAWSVKEYHAAHAPANERWEDTVGFHSQFLMDDQVLVEPDVGLRAYQSGKVAVEGIQTLLGEGALNLRKEQEEGQMETVKLCWGLLYDTEKEQVTMPEPKVEKANYLLADPEFDHGCEKVSTKFLEQYRGNQQYWAIVMPCMRHLLGTTDAMLRGGGRCGYANPGVCEVTRAQAFQDFWEDVELARILVSDRGKWNSRFVGAMTGVLTVNERMALPKCPEVVWVTGDATLERIATVDWSSKRVAVHLLDEFWKPLAEAMGAAAEEEAIIAVAELLNFVTYAAWASRAGLWRDRIVMYTGDNMNVHCWLSSRRCKNRYAGFALRLLCALEAAYSFETFSAFFRTYHNVTADAFTRKAKAELEDMKKQHGLETVDLRQAWGDHLDRGWMRRALVWDGQESNDRGAALRLAERRGPAREIPRSPTTPRADMRPGAELRVVEWRGTIGNIAKAAARGGATAWMLSAPRGPTEGCTAWPAGILAAPEAAGFFDVVVATLTDDKGEEARRWAGYVLHQEAAVAIADAPRTADLTPAKNELISAGYSWAVVEVNATALGDGTARRRNLVAAAKTDRLEEKVQKWLAERQERALPPRRARDFLVRSGSESATAAIAAAEGTFEEDPRMPRIGGHNGPRPCGHLKMAGKRHVVYDTSYPLPSLRSVSVSPGAEGSVYLADAASHSGVRALLPEEVWRAHGGDAAVWQRARKDGCDEELLLAWALRASPTELARAEFALAMHLMADLSGGRAGVCSLKHEERSRGRMLRWLEAWAHNPTHPSKAQKAGGQIEASSTTSGLIRDGEQDSARQQGRGTKRDRLEHIRNHRLDREEAEDHPFSNDPSCCAAAACRGSPTAPVSTAAQDVLEVQLLSSPAAATAPRDRNQSRKLVEMPTSPPVASTAFHLTAGCDTHYQTVPEELYAFSADAPAADTGFGLEGSRGDDRRAGALDGTSPREELADFVEIWAGAEAGWLTRATTWEHAGGERRVGGGPRRPREQIAGPANLKGPEALMRDGCAPIEPTKLSSKEKWDQAKLQLVLDKLADGTKKTYSIGWRWWALFCRVRGETPLRRVTHDRVQAEEEIFLDFVVHLAEHGLKAVGTIKQYLSAIRAQHLALGYPDPTGPMGRLWMAIDGLKRRQGGPARKRPVTPRMLRWIGEGLKPAQSHDDAMLWAATLTAYFFLLRASEYTSPDQTGHETGKGLRGQDLVFKTNGNITQAYSQADEVVICIRGSKTDQLNRGEYRNHHRVPDEAFAESRLCVVRALAGYARWAPERFGGISSGKSLFMWSDGRLLLRHQIHALVARSAVAEGLKYDDISSHSLRIGGASALWAKYQDSALVQRWGRWRSDAFHGYLWDTREAARGIATGMGMADLTAV